MMGHVKLVEKKNRFIVYLCLKCNDNMMFCLSCCSKHNICQYSCFKCTGSKLMIMISRWYRENAGVFSNFNGEIITRRETEPFKCDNCFSFYCSNTSYRCDCSYVFKRYCNKCCENNEIKVKSCSKCDNGIDDYLVSIYYKTKFNKYKVY